MRVAFSAAICFASTPVIFRALVIPVRIAVAVPILIANAAYVGFPASHFLVVGATARTVIITRAIAIRRTAGVTR